MVSDLHGQIDLALAFAVLHESKDKKKFIEEIGSTLKSGALFLFGEPHVITRKEFDDSITLIQEYGFFVEELIGKGNNNIALLRKKNGNIK